MSQVFTIEPEQIECVKHWLTTATKQLIELAASLIVQANDLAVEYGITYAQTSQSFTERTKALVHIVLSGDQIAASITDVGESTEAVILQLFCGLRRYVALGMEFWLGRHMRTAPDAT
jgi:hypothetical protein